MKLKFQNNFFIHFVKLCCLAENRFMKWIVKIVIETKHVRLHIRSRLVFFSFLMKINTDVFRPYRDDGWFFFLHYFCSFKELLNIYEGVALFSTSIGNQNYLTVIIDFFLNFLQQPTNKWHIPFLFF